MIKTISVIILLYLILQILLQLFAATTVVEPHMNKRIIFIGILVWPITLMILFIGFIVYAFTWPFWDE